MVYTSNAQYVSIFYTNGFSRLFGRGASPHANPPLHMYMVYTNNAQYVSIFYIFTMTEIGNLNSILMYFDIFYSNRFMNLDAYLGVSLGNLNY